MHPREYGLVLRAELLVDDRDQVHRGPRLDSAPTLIEIDDIAAVRAGGVHSVCHVTGGGFTENIPRVLPADVAARIDRSSWELPPISAPRCAPRLPASLISTRH